MLDPRIQIGTSVPAAGTAWISLAGRCRRKIGLQLQNVLRKALGSLRPAPQRAQGKLIGARGAAKPEVDPARKQARQGAELLGDDIGGVVRQHDPARPDPDRVRSRGDVGDHDRSRGAGDARHVVMLRHPDAAIAPLLGMGGEVARVVERGAGVGAFGDAGEVEDGQGRHCRLRGRRSSQRLKHEATGLNPGVSAK